MQFCPMPTRKSPKLTVRIERHEHAAIIEYAAERGTTPTEIVRAYVLRLLRVAPTPPQRVQKKQEN